MRNAWMVVAAAALTAGCSEVNTPYPVGSPVPHEEAEALNGTWQTEDGLLHMRHAGGGRIVVATAEWDAEEGRFELVQDTLMLGRIGDVLVLSFPKDDAPGRYNFAAVQPDEAGHLLGWGPKVRFFADAVREGTLEGTIVAGVPSTEDVRITSGKEAFDAFLADQPRGAIFDLETVIVLRRVPDLRD